MDSRTRRVQPQSDPGGDEAVRRTRALAAMATTAICSMVLTAPPASAATITETTSLSLEGTSTKPVNLGLSALHPFSPLLNGLIDAAEFFDNGNTDGDLWGLQLDVTSIDFDLDFDAPTDISSAYTDGLLTEGEEVDIDHTLVAKDGSVTLKATINGAVGVSKNGSLTAASIPFSPTLDFGTDTCQIPVPGTTEDDCSFALNVPIVPVPIIPGLVTATLTLGISAAVEVSPTGFATVREYEVVPVTDTDNLSFTSPTLADPYTLPCLTAGKDLTATFTSSALSIEPAITPTLRLFIAWDIVG
jgi:hypothetical protein